MRGRPCRAFSWPAASLHPALQPREQTPDHQDERMAQKERGEYPRPTGHQLTVLEQRGGGPGSHSSPACNRQHRIRRRKFRAGRTRGGPQRCTRTGRLRFLSLPLDGAGADLAWWRDAPAGPPAPGRRGVLRGAGCLRPGGA